MSDLDAYREVLNEARRVYDAATQFWYHHREMGGIVEETDPQPGVLNPAKWKATTPEAKRAMGLWQKAKAELDGALANLKVTAAALPDPRLPPEREDEDVPF